MITVLVDVVVCQAILPIYKYSIVMTLQECILKKHNELLGEEIDSSNELNIEDISIMITSSEKRIYSEVLQHSLKLGIVKLLIESAKTYGEAKFYEGVEAARQAIADESVPLFKP